MAMSPTVLTGQFITKLLNSDSIEESAENFSECWTLYFLDALAGGISFQVDDSIQEVFKSKILEMDLYQFNGTQKIQEAVLSWWGKISVSPSVYFPMAILSTVPPGISTIKARLDAIITSNYNATREVAFSRLANILHTSNLGGTITVGFPPNQNIYPVL